LNEPQVDVHLEEIPVPLPFTRIFDFRERVKGIRKIRLERLLEVKDVFHRIVRVLVEVEVVELVKLLGILDFVRETARAKERKACPE
jgi:hypothetical protein